VAQLRAYGTVYVQSRCGAEPITAIEIVHINIHDVCDWNTAAATAASHCKIRPSRRSWVVTATSVYSPCYSNWLSWYQYIIHPHYTSLNIHGESKVLSYIFQQLLIWTSAKICWVGHNATRPANNCPVYLIFLAYKMIICDKK